MWPFASGNFMKRKENGRFFPHLTIWYRWRNVLHLQNSKFQSWTFLCFVACTMPSSLSCRQTLLQHCFQVHEFMCRMAVWRYASKHRIITHIFKTKMSDLEHAFSALRPCTTSRQPFSVLLTNCRATTWPPKKFRTLLPPPMLAENSSNDDAVLPPPANRFRASRLFKKHDVPAWMRSTEVLSCTILHGGLPSWCCSSSSCCSWQLGGQVVVIDSNARLRSCDWFQNNDSQRSLIEMLLCIFFAWLWWHVVQCSCNRKFILEHHRTSCYDSCWHHIGSQHGKDTGCLSTLCQEDRDTLPDQMDL